MPQAVEGHLADDRDRGRVDQFPHVRAHQGEAHDHLAVFVHDHAGLPAVALGVQCSPGHGGEVVVHHTHGQSSGGRGCGSQPDRGNLGRGENDLGNGAFIGGQGVSAPGR